MIDSCCGGGGGGGGDYSCDDSLVFKYTPGRETPPAEYSLPASILRVYGDDADDLLPLPDPPSFVDDGGGGGSFDSSVVAAGGMGIAPRWRADSDGGGSRASSIVFVDATTTGGASATPSPVVGGRESLKWSSSSSSSGGGGRGREAAAGRTERTEWPPQGVWVRRERGRGGVGGLSFGRRLPRPRR